MAAQNPEEQDAVARARTEVNLLLQKYARRLKTRAVEIALDLMMRDPERDPDEAGRRAASQAGKELKLLTRNAASTLEKE